MFVLVVVLDLVVGGVEWVVIVVVVMIVNMMEVVQILKRLKNFLFDDLEYQYVGGEYSLQCKILWFFLLILVGFFCEKGVTL